MRKLHDNATAGSPAQNPQLPVSTTLMLRSVADIARVALARSVGELGHYLARARSGAAVPAMIRFISRIASRYQLQVTEKVAAQAVPLLGVAVINNLFIGHFRDVGRGHLTERRLERIYSAGQVAREYDRL